MPLRPSTALSVPTELWERMWGRFWRKQNLSFYNNKINQLTGDPLRWRGFVRQQTDLAFEFDSQSGVMKHAYIL